MRLDRPSVSAARRWRSAVHVELTSWLMESRHLSFFDYAAEQTHTLHAVMEAALAHRINDKAEAAYARSDLFEKRQH